ncbi:redox-regulated ATPase YchF [Candidatus Falkowbacteria bacterium]|jgi:ribosome-binding ATPase|nr:redox-regulated ATPase YchF [Candidatus Falkowbacteria bacterium]MBT4432855.1 redox-regulated ATPase YchF [Candidatus Falkowbacteria bacterium]
MSFSIGIVGLPNVGKSTLFKTLTKKRVDAENYPFCTIDPNVGTVKVPDKKLDKLAEVLQATEKVPTIIEFVDIAGLVKGASQGEGLGNKFLANIREVDAICQVVRDFENSDIVHVHNKIDPEDDLRTINLELILADLEIVSNKIDRLKKTLRSGADKQTEKIISILEKIEGLLKNEKLAIKANLDDEEKSLVKDLNLLTLKPMIYLRNIDEKSETVSKFKDDYAAIEMNIKMEADLAELSEEDAKEYRQELGIKESGLNKLILASYQILDLITFYSAAAKNINQAWTVKKGATGPQAAGVIHSDFEQGFIRVEVINIDQLIECTSETIAKEKGLIRTEGKDYIIKDGDVCHFLFAN